MNLFISEGKESFLEITWEQLDYERVIISWERIACL